ncbi:hypothetical protein EVG20_g3675 [Dentipellis fragilis]|uniref:DNA replication complex GINS protein PSF1 n=1 Tax=Dentipellis fragilis TaxID=205917 RepID=A0A4Y9Z0I8_9AGAM|nr:hypothetical protein EVG20_g3675 [Dentipellis fragilis]
MSSSTRQFGDLATQLLLESRRSTQTDTLIKYNDTLVRAVIREQRDLEKLIQVDMNGDHVNEAPTPALLLYQTAVLRNKRCLLAYHQHRIDFLRTLFWSSGASLPHILSPEFRSRLSPQEVDFLRTYNTTLLSYRSAFSAELDLTAPITHPPKDLHALVRVIKDCGVIQTESGAIDFRRGQRFMVRRADVEHLIVQGYLEEV